jgi:nitrate reductase NapE component
MSKKKWLIALVAAVVFGFIAVGLVGFGLIHWLSYGPSSRSRRGWLGAR